MFPQCGHQRIELVEGAIDPFLVFRDVAAVVAESADDLITQQIGAPFPQVTNILLRNFFRNRTHDAASCGKFLHGRRIFTDETGGHRKRLRSRQNLHRGISELKHSPPLLDSEGDGGTLQRPGILTEVGDLLPFLLRPDQRRRCGPTADAGKVAEGAEDLAADMSPGGVRSDPPPAHFRPEADRFSGNFLRIESQRNAPGFIGRIGVFRNRNSVDSVMKHGILPQRELGWRQRC